MPDRQFNPLGTPNAPADWTLPANLHIDLKQAFATFDGTGAAGNFLPCLEIISDSGHKIGSYPVDTTVAAGASADVTWFRGVAGTGGGSTTSASVALAYGQGGGGQTTPTNTSTTYGFATVASSSSDLVWSSGTHTNDTLTVNNTGALIALASCNTLADRANLNIYVDSSTTGIQAHSSWITPQVGDGTAPPEGFSDLMDQCWFDLTSSGATFHLVYSNGSAFDNGITAGAIGFVFFAGAVA